MKRARKIIVAALVLYWPGIFLLTHIPRVPRWAVEGTVSDKTAHFLAFLGLSFLWWLAFSPGNRVNWTRPLPWITLCVMAIYAFLDEWLQGFVGRNPDVHDFFADMLGVVAAMALLTIFNFWSASIIVAAAVLFATTNFIRFDIVAVWPFSSMIFYLFGYAAVAFCWTVRIEGYCGANLKRLAALFSVPMVILAIVHGYALATGRGHHSPVIWGLVGITTVILVASMSMVRKRSLESSPVC